MTPAKPLPMEVPVTSTFWPSSNISTLISLPTSILSLHRHPSGIPTNRDPLRSRPWHSARHRPCLVTREARRDRWSPARHDNRQVSSRLQLGHPVRLNREPYDVTGYSRRHLQVKDACHTFLRPTIPIVILCTLPINSSWLIQLDLNIHAGCQIQLHQRINRLVSRIHNIHQTLVRTDLVLVTRILVDMRRNQYGKTLFLGGQRNWTPHLRTGALGCFNNFCRRLIDQTMIEGLQTDPDSLIAISTLTVINI